MALLLTLTLSMALATSAYAAENDNSKSTENAETTSAVQPKGMVVAGGSTNLSNGSGTIYVTLDKDIYGAEFMFSVMGNPSGQYHCNVVWVENNYNYSVGDVSGNGYGTTKWWPWLQKGTYKFYIYTTNLNYGAASAVAHIKVNTKITKKGKIKITNLDNFLLYRIVKVFYFI